MPRNKKNIKIPARVAKKVQGDFNRVAGLKDPANGHDRREGHDSNGGVHRLAGGEVADEPDSPLVRNGAGVR